MCGIAGFIDAGGDEQLVPALDRALLALAHRGPDDSGIVVHRPNVDRGPVVGLGNRRLSIIDLSPAGHQPMTTADGRYSLTYNGEVYNAVALRSQLVALGHQFHSDTDTEVFLEAYAEWGVEAFARMEGMFAAAILDRPRQQVVLVRDVFGIKPLFYHQSRGRLVFASELGALRAFGGVGRGVHAAQVHDFLRQVHVAHPVETLFVDVQQLAPAHYLVAPIDRSRAPSAVRYWRLSTATSDISYADATEQLRALVLGSVARHLRSDVPIGFSLSGGLDSSSVLLAARRASPDGELHAFSFVTDDAELAESEYQEIAATAAGAVRHAVRFDAAQLVRDFDKVVDLQGEPFASPAICAQYAVFARAREQGVRVILGGQGSDELFAGYAEYFPARVASLLRRGRFAEAAHFVRAAADRWKLSPRALVRGALGMSAPVAVRALVRGMRGQTPVHPWLAAAWFEERHVEAPSAWFPRGRELMKDQLLHVIEDVHLQPLMRYEDRSSMALSMESRVPFLTHLMGTFALSLPESYLVSRDAEQKAVLRDAMRGVVPDAILDRRDKIGFGVPVARWLNESAQWVEQRMPLVRACPAINSSVIDRHWRAVRERSSVASAYLVWRCLVLATWAERHEAVWQ